MLNKINDTRFQGTIKDFVDAGLKINKHNVDAVTLSGMGRYQMFQQVGVKKPARGRSAAVYEIDFNANRGFSF